MTRAEVAAFLARCVRDRLITEPQAVELLRQFDAGTLKLDALPIPPDEFITGLTRADIDEALS